MHSRWARPRRLLAQSSRTPRRHRLRARCKCRCNNLRLLQARHRPWLPSPKEILAKTCSITSRASTVQETQTRRLSRHALHRSRSAACCLAVVVGADPLHHSRKSTSELQWAETVAKQKRIKVAGRLRARGCVLRLASRRHLSLSRCLLCGILRDGQRVFRSYAIVMNLKSE